jgi:hypothetical protein
MPRDTALSSGGSRRCAPRSSSPHASSSSGSSRSPSG